MRDVSTLSRILRARTGRMPVLRGDGTLAQEPRYLFVECVGAFHGDEVAAIGDAGFFGIRKKLVQLGAVIHWEDLIGLAP